MPLLGKTTKYAKFLGRPVLYTQSLGALGALMGAATELGVAALIQMLLVALKVSPQPTSGLLSHWVITIEMVGWALLALALLRSGALFLTNFAPAFAGDLFQERLRNFLVHWIVHSPHPPSLTRTQTLLGDTIPKTAQFANFISYAFPILVQMAALVGVMVAMCPKEAAVALCLLVVVGFVVLKLNRRVRHLSHDLPMAQRTVVQTIERVAYNWLLVYVLGTQRQEQSRFETHAREFTAKSKKAHFWVCLAAAAAPALGILILILVIFLSQKVFLTSASRLLTFLYLFVRFVQLGAAVTHYFGSLNSLWPFFKDCYSQFIGIALGENQELHLKKADAKDSDLASEGGALVTRTPLAPSCEVENLSFSHGADKELFAQMNLKVGSGSQVGIVGPSGAGKSTLLQLLLGVLRPKKGQVLWAGLDPQQLLRSRPGQSRMRVGYVGAEPFLFSGTLEENLVYGCQEPPSAAQMLAVLRKLNLHTTGAGEPRNLGDYVDVGGKNFSAGERQRLCFARAILARPQLLVLDEATANLDVETESKMAELLAELKSQCTTLVVSHRPGILAHADVIWDLNELKGVAKSVT